jgi:hypothetical protein
VRDRQDDRGGEVEGKEKGCKMKRLYPQVMGTCKIFTPLFLAASISAAVLASIFVASITSLTAGWRIPPASEQGGDAAAEAHSLRYTLTRAREIVLKLNEHEGSTT